MKKILSLVLVIVMVFSLMTFASAKDPTAAFTDGKDVKNVAAVDLLTGLGIIDGANGAFDPAGTLTREQAAKIIAYLLNGTAATNLKAITAPFTDVAATRWSAGYIAFCVEEGILNGVGDNKFNPEGKLTGFAWAKMLLCALGYDASAEEFIGGSWTINVAKTVNKISLALGLNLDFSANISRDDACALAANTLTADLVEYASSGTTITIGDTTVATAKGPAQKVDKAGGGYLNSGNDTIMQFCEMYFKDLQKKITTNFGRNGYKWVSAGTGSAISAFYGTDKTLATSYSGVNVTSLTTPSNYFYKASLNGVVSYVLNGQAGSTLSLCDAAALTKGTQVELLDVFPYDGKVDIVVVTTMTAATLPSNPVTTATSGSVTNVTVANTTITTKDAKYVSGYEGLAKDDVVLYYTLRNENGFDYFYIVKCKTVTGTLSAYNSVIGTLTIDGTGYYDSALGSFNPATDVTGLYGVAGVTFYLDMGGQIVKAASPEATFNLANYLFVKAAANTGGTLTNRYEAAVTFMDGTTAVITVAKTGLSTGSLAVVADADCTDPYNTAGELADYTYYSFVKNEDGTYNLRVAANQTEVTGVTATTPSANFLNNHGYATGDTTFVYQNAQGTFNVYKGVTSAPTYSIVTPVLPAVLPAYAGVYVLLNPTNPAYAMAAVGLSGTASGIPGDMKQVYITGAGTQHWLSGTTYYNTYPAVVDGKTEQTIETVDGVVLDAGKLYLVTEYTGGRISDAIDFTDGTWLTLAHIDQAVGTVTYNAGTLVVDGMPYVMTSDVKVFVYNTTVIPAALTEITADSINGYATQINGNDSVTVVTKNGASDPAIKYVYITLQTPATGAIDTLTAGASVVSNTTPKTVAVAATAGVGKTVQFTKGNNQTITISGITPGPVTPGTADFTFTLATAGTYNYTLTVSELGFADIVYTVTVTVAAAPVAATSVSIDATLTLISGNNATLTATVLPANATDKTVSWLSSDTNVATVVNGVVTAVAPGTATITVTTTSGGHIDTCAVTVNAPVIGITSQPADGTTSGGDFSTTIVATVTGGATLSYQWYSNTTDSNAGGTIIAGAIGATLNRTGLLATSYYYCVVSATGGATPVTSDAVTATFGS